MLKLLHFALGAMKASVLLVFVFFVWKALATAPWPLIVLAAVGVPVAIWLHVTYWQPRKRGD